MLNPEGKEANKALVFEKVLGYNESNGELLRKRILINLQGWKARSKPDVGYGPRAEVKMLIKGANGRIAPVTTGWIYDKGGPTPRLTSAYVDERKGKKKR